MTFGDLIKIMNSANVFKRKRDDIAANLLKAAGICKEIDAGITKWIDKKVPDNICRYFIDEKVNEAKVGQYFRDWTKDNWKELQEKFLPEKDGCIVDCVTDDREVFYQSLVNQFIKSLGLPLQEKSDNDISPFEETESMSPSIGALIPDGSILLEPITRAEIDDIFQRVFTESKTS